MNRYNLRQINIVANRKNIYEMKLWQIGIGIYLWPKYQQIDSWQIYSQTICKLFANREVFAEHCFAATSRSPMSKLFRFFESLRKTNENKWSQIWILLLTKGVKLSRKKSLIFDKFCLTSRILLVSVLLSALVERCFVSRMRLTFGFYGGIFKFCYQRSVK